MTIRLVRWGAVVCKFNEIKAGCVLSNCRGWCTGKDEDDAF